MFFNTFGSGLNVCNVIFDNLAGIPHFKFYEHSKLGYKLSCMGYSWNSVEQILKWDTLNAPQSFVANFQINLNYKRNVQKCIKRRYTNRKAGLEISKR